MPRSRDAGTVHLALAAGAGTVALLVLAIVAAAGAGLDDATQCRIQPDAAQDARTIPADYLRMYRAAGRATGIAWNLLAAVGRVESNHGRTTQPGIRSGANPAGAAGPMQFGIEGRAGNTWGGPPRHRADHATGGYGTDGDHDGWADVYDPADAIPAAAHYLKAHGAPGDIRGALFSYNHSVDYIDTVTMWAGRYARDGDKAIAAAQTPGCAQAADTMPIGGVASKVIAYARAQIGKPYIWGATGPDAFDCSGLTLRAYQAAGITIPRIAADQWAREPHIPDGHEQPGDLVFFTGADGTTTRPGHVGIVIGHTQAIAAPRKGERVKIQSYAHRRDLIGFARPR